MKYRASLLMFGIGVAVGVVASAVAETGSENAQNRSYLSNPKECETVVSNLLKFRQNALHRRERTISVRESEIRAAEKRMKQQLSDLSNLRDELREKMKQMDEVQLQEIDRLVKMFEKMRGKQVAGILAETDETISVEVLRLMKKGPAGKTMAKLPPKKAAALAELMTQHKMQKAVENQQ